MSRNLLTKFTGFFFVLVLKTDNDRKSGFATMQQRRGPNARS